MVAGNQVRWWKGTRGEWLVVAQVALMALVFFGPSTIWVFHGAGDREVEVERSREMVEALRAAGGSVEYTEYGSSGHAIWDQVYAEKSLIDWLFAQSKHGQSEW